MIPSFTASDYQAMLETTASGIVMTRDRIIQYCNQRLCEMSGYEADELIGRHTRELYGNEYSWTSTGDAVYPAILNGERAHIDVPLKCRDGHLIWTRMSGRLLDTDAPERGVVWFLEDISAERAFMNQLSQSIEEQQAIFDSATSGIALLRDRKHLRCNRRLCEMLGYELHEMIGQTTRLWYPDDASWMRAGELAYPAINEGQTYRFELQLKRSDGSLFWARLSGHVLDIADIDKGSVWTIDDISAEREMVEELREAKALAEESAKAKADFLANMSHEIRTPMNAVIGMTHLALQTQLDDQQRNYLEKIGGAAKNLLTIINDILDVSKIEAGELTFEHATFELDELIAHVTDLSLPAAEKKGLEFRVDVEPGVPATLIGDALRLGQVLINLVNNAIKFTERGSIRVRISSAEAGEEDVRLLFEVTDTGIGLSEEQCGKLFRAFSQADASTTRRFGGTGLGLSISRHLVERMEGEIGVDSQPGVGSRFHFTAKLGRQAGEEQAPAPQPQSRADRSWKHHKAVCERKLRGSHLLLVEDYAVNRELILGLLASIDARIDIATNGAEAVRLVQENDYDGILMDCQMPVMDGYEATRRIRSDPRFSGLPILAMTAHAMSGDRERCLDSGMNDHIAKPIDVGNLYRMLDQWIEPKTSPEPVPTTAEQGQTTRAELRPEDRAALSRLLARLAEQLQKADAKAVQTATVVAGILRALHQDTLTDTLVRSIGAGEYAQAAERLERIATTLEIELPNRQASD